MRRLHLSALYFCLSSCFCFFSFSLTYFCTEQCLPCCFKKTQKGTEILLHISCQRQQTPLAYCSVWWTYRNKFGEDTSIREKIIWRQLIIRETGLGPWQVIIPGLLRKSRIITPIHQGQKTSPVRSPTRPTACVSGK